MKFSVTERGTVKRCERLAVYTSKNAMHLTPLFSPLALSLGSLMHKGFQNWLENPNKTFHDHIMEAGIAMQAKAALNYRRRVGAAPSEAELSTIYEAVDFGLVMATNYQIRWGSALPDGYRLIKAEQKIEVPVPGTEHKCPSCDGRGTSWVHDDQRPCPECDGEGTARHKLVARLDAMFQHIKTGRIDIDEHKTYKNRPNEETIRYNDQFISYIWQVMQLHLSDQDPFVLYDGMWRRMEIPKKATFNDLFARYSLQRLPSEIKEFGRQLPLELNAMAALYTTPEQHTMNRQWQGCFDCQFRKLCQATSRGEDTTQMLQTDFLERDDDTDTEEETDD